MTRDRARKLLPIMQAYAEGKKIEHKYIEGCLWSEIVDLDCTEENYEYRIKQEEPKERPFKDCDELIKRWKDLVGCVFNVKLCEHTIWLKHKVDESRKLITCYGDNWIKFGAKTKPVSMKELFDNYTFLNGEPCGVVN